MAKNKLVKYCVVDAFTDSAFKGNPAAVCFLEEERDEQWLQSLAAEFNLSQTCYLTPFTHSEAHNSSIPRFHLRWFAPITEVKLCGHGSLASAHALFTTGKVDSDTIEFVTLSGILTARKVADNSLSGSCDDQNGEMRKSFLIELNFPSDQSTDFYSADYSMISNALGSTSIVTIKRAASDRLIVVLPSAEDVTRLKPDFAAVSKCPGEGIIVTGIAPPESGFDFHSRYFCPKFNINEDPVCGSANCALAPFWSKELGKCDFVAYQASSRGGILKLHMDDQNQRVLLKGKAITVMEGYILV